MLNISNDTVQVLKWSILIVSCLKRMCCIIGLISPGEHSCVSSHLSPTSLSIKRPQKVCRKCRNHQTKYFKSPRRTRISQMITDQFCASARSSFPLWFGYQQSRERRVSSFLSFLWASDLSVPRTSPDLFPLQRGRRRAYNNTQLPSDPLLTLQTWALPCVRACVREILSIHSSFFPARCPSPPHQDDSVRMRACGSKVTHMSGSERGGASHKSAAFVFPISISSSR